MRKLTINKIQVYFADKIIKKDNDVKLISAKQKIDGELQELGNLLFPNISRLEDFVIEDGKDFDTEIDLQQQIDDLEMFILMQGGLV